MSNVERTGPVEEGRFHRYTGNAIPWYVRLIWVVFWIFAVYYTVKYFLPTIQSEMVAPP